ncbi:MAG TPA: VWA domain-containing protein [Gemmataceae bacterium]|nr:VWA domain-containing protein [Gemmataceae bacterium]
MLMRYWFPLAVLALVLLALPAIVLFGYELFGYGPVANAWLESRTGLSHHTSINTTAAVILFLVPLGLLLLYFLKLKRKPQAVPSTFLWKKSIEDLHVNRLLQWIRKNILLLLQLLVLLAAIYAILAPRINGSQTAGKHYILMIDNSASMTATDVKPTRLDWAKAEALKEVDAATDSDTGMVIVFNSTAEIRQSYTTNRALLRKAVEDIRPTNNPTAVDEALSLAASLANPLASTEDAAVRPDNPEPGKERQYAAPEGISAEIHLYSDGRFADVANFALSNLGLTFHAPATGAPGTADNVGIVRFDAVRDEADPTKLQAFVRVLNYRNEPVKVGADLDVLTEGKTVRDVRHRDLPLPKRDYRAPTKKKDENGNEIPNEFEDPGIDVPGEGVAKFDLTGIDENSDVVLRVKLTGIKDAFATDNEAWVVLGIVRKGRVLLVTPGNRLLEDFFNLRSTRALADVVTIAPADLKKSKEYVEPAREGKYDLVIFDRCGPATEDDMPRSNTVFVGHPPPPWHLGGDADDRQVTTVQFPPIKGWTDADPVMRGLRGWHELEIADALKFNNLPPKTPRLVEGERGHLLMFTLSRQAYRDLVVAFPLETDGGKMNTRWFLKPLFPLFLGNVLYTLGNVKTATTEESVRPGSPKYLRPFGDVKEITVRNPGEADTRLERGTRAEFSFSATGDPGVYAATWEKETRRFAVNLFDPNESHIEPRPSVKIGDVEVTAGPPRKEARELWRWVVLAGLIFLLLEWWIYNRRVHV